MFNMIDIKSHGSTFYRYIIKFIKKERVNTERTRNFPFMVSTTPMK